MLEHGDWPVRLAATGLIKLDEDPERDPDGPATPGCSGWAGVGASEAGEGAAPCLPASPPRPAASRRPTQTFTPGARRSGMVGHD
jgi:hypothetical protein